MSPLAVATVEASNGTTPFWSTKIVAEEGAPTHCFTTRTVATGGGGTMMFVIVQVRVAPSVAGDVTENGPPAYGCGPCPQSIVAV